MTRERRGGSSNQHEQRTGLEWETSDSTGVGERARGGTASRSKRERAGA